MIARFGVFSLALFSFAFIAASNALGDSANDDQAAIVKEINQDPTINLHASYYEDSIALEIHDYSPLTLAEELAVAYYTGMGYMSIDHYLTHGTPTTPVSVRLLDQALAKLPAYIGEIYHADSTLDISRLHKGIVLNYPGYVSASKARGVYKGRLSIHITQKHARDISRFSLLSYEQEVLLPHGSRLELISNVYKDDTDGFAIDAIEL